MRFRRSLLAPLLACAASLLAARADAAAALGGFAAAPGASADDPAALCEDAAARAARAEGVPQDVMRALALTETGRRLDGRHRPWAWTVNMEGKGKWFPDRRSALEWTRAHHARGARSYDVGCFQINRRWHGEAFPSLEAMFDPDRNAAYAARFLKSLRAEAGSWETAAGWYHSRTPEYANRYRARFSEILARLDPPPAPPPAPPPPPRRQRERTVGGPLIALADAGAAPARGGSLAGAAFARGGGLLRTARPLFD